MKEKIEAVNYGLDSNKLEGNNLTEQEVQTVIDGIDRSDGSFLQSVVELVEKGQITSQNNDSKEDDLNVKTKK